MNDRYNYLRSHSQAATQPPKLKLPAGSVRECGLGFKLINLAPINRIQLIGSN